MRDVHSAAPIKRTAVEKQVNVHIIFLFIFLLALSIGSTIGSSIRAVSEMASGSSYFGIDVFLVVLFRSRVVSHGAVVDR